MAQVLTNENMVDFIQTRSVPEFKSPEAPKQEAKVEPSDKPSEKAEDQPRDEGGKFAKKDAPKQEEKPAEVKVEKSTVDEDDYSQASEEVRRKIDKIIAKKHRAMKEAEEFGRDEARRALAAEARAAELQKQIDALSAPKKSEGPDTAGDEPKPEDFKTVGEYTRALVKYEAQQEKKAREAESSKSAEKDAEAKVQERMLKQIEEVRKEHDDFAEVMQAVKWEAPKHIATFIIESDNGARMAYHLAKHEEDYHRIAALTPVRAIAELGKLEDKLFSEPPEEEKAPERTVSKAPPPIQPLEAKSTPVVKDPKDMSFAELRAYRESQKKDGKWRPY